MTTGTSKPARMVTARIPLDVLVRVGYRELMGNTGEHMKIIVSPRG